jgi:peptidyl-prolyl cis-trans isomerase D
MLDILRANTRSVLTYVLFGIIIVVFVVSFGPASKGCSATGMGGPAYAARVNDRTITVGEFQQAYADLLRAYQSRLGSAFSAEFAAQMGLGAQALDQLVDRELVISEARKAGIVVTDADLSRYVEAIPGLQRDGQFQMDMYKQWASRNYGSPAKFEERLRRDLVFQNMIALLRQSVNVSEDEVKSAWLDESDRVNLSFVRFPVAAAKGEVKISDADLQAFLAASGARIEQFYKDNSQRYQKKKQVHARHILARVPEKAPASAWEAAHKKIEALAERVKKGEDFAKLATENSDDPGSKASGGDLGFFGEGAMAKPFEEAAFALAPGQVSGPVRTQFGWHLIRVDEVRNPENIPLDKARSDIARELLTDDRAKALAKQHAQEALAKLQAGKKLADLFPPPPAATVQGKKPEPAAAQPVTVEETGLFGRSKDSVPKLGSVPELVTNAFQSETGRVLPKVYDTATGPVVAVVKERQHPDPAKFAERKSDLAERLRGRREVELETAWIKDVRKTAKISINEALARGELPQVPNEPLE